MTDIVKKDDNTIDSASVTLYGYTEQDQADRDVIPVIVGSNGGITTQNIGVNVPPTFTKITENAKRTILQKGQLNKTNMYPRILNEHAESSREIQGVIDATTIVGQIFKASKDNITALGLTLESDEGISLDNFESYANSSALQSAWVATGNLALLEQSIVKSGTKSMALPGDTLNDEWVYTITSTDFTNYTGNFDAYFTKEFNKFKVSVFIGDGTNTKSFQLAFANKDSWYHFDIAEASMTEDGGGTTLVSAITKIGFRIDDPDGGEYCYIDNLLATPPPGSVEIKLWDMGTSLPASGTTSINSGTQYTKIGGTASSYTLSLLGGKRLYHIREFTCGNEKAIPTNELLNKDHYYIIELKYIDTDIDVFGPNSSFNYNYYNNGYAFTAPNEATAITQIGTYNDIMFTVFSTQDIYITEIEWMFDDVPNGDSDISVFLEDTDMKITDMIVDHEEEPPQESEENVSSRPMFLEDGGKLEFYYSDDFTDGVSQVKTEMFFYYEPPIVNG